MFSTQNTEQHSKKHKTQITIKSPSTTKGSSYKVSLKQKSKRIDEGLNLSTSGQNTCVIPLSYSLNYILNLHNYLYLSRFGWFWGEKIQHRNWNWNISVSRNSNLNWIVPNQNWKIGLGSVGFGQIFRFTNFLHTPSY